MTGKRIVHYYTPRKTSTFYDNENRAMVRNIHKFLKDEYKFTMLHRECLCDFSHLRNITRRTAEAAGISTRTVHRIVSEEVAQQSQGRPMSTNNTCGGTCRSIIPSQCGTINEESKKNMKSSNITASSTSGILNPLRIDSDIIRIDDSIIEDRNLNSSPAEVSNRTNSTGSTACSSNATTTTKKVKKNNMLIMEIDENGQISKTFLQ